MSTTPSSCWGLGLRRRLAGPCYRRQPVSSACLGVGLGDILDLRNIGGLSAYKLFRKPSSAHCCGSIVLGASIIGS